MKASELRHGNLFQLDLDESIWELDHITPGTEWLFWVKENDGTVKSFVKESDSEGIPLTEEWLLKFGWVKKINPHENYFLDEFRIMNSKEVFELDLNGMWIKIKYVHQLQNLYFALTGEELNIKP